MNIFKSHQTLLSVWVVHTLYTLASVIPEPGEGECSLTCVYLKASQHFPEYLLSGEISFTSSMYIFYSLHLPVKESKATAFSPPQLEEE